MASDPEISQYFSSSSFNKEKHYSHLANYLTDVINGKEAKSMKETHERFNIKEEHFDRALDMFKSSMK